MPMPALLPATLTQHKAVIIEPYPYAVDGKDVLITYVAKLVVIDGKVVGIAGLDLSLQDTSKSLAKVHPMGTGVIITTASHMLAMEVQALNQLLTSSSWAQPMPSGVRARVSY